MNQFSLLGKKRFLPFFMTQALGAFNDNLFKNVLLLFIAFSGLYSQESSTALINLAAGLFILPFFLLSPIGGQLADKYEKSSLIRKIKLTEIVIMSGGALAVWFQFVPGMLVALFLMGAQSALFGPVKFALMPQHLNGKELVGGNAVVEMGTFTAILGGTVCAGLLFDSEFSTMLVVISVLLLSVFGYLASRSIPYAKANDPELSVNWNPASQLIRTVRHAKENRTVFLSILAISWFWFIGATYLTQLPNFAKEFLGGNPQLVTLLLTVFSVGIAAGSLICEKMSGGKIELGIIPIGALGISIFGFDLYFACQQLVTEKGMTVTAFLNHGENIRLLADLALVSASGGIFVVPLNALIQQRSEEKSRAQTIAANNVMNALFMVLSAVVAVLVLNVLGLSILQLFLMISVLNVLVSLYVFSQVHEFLLRFVIWVLSHTIYRVSHKDLENIPEQGAAVLVCNHVSYVDALLIAGSCPRPVRFVMDKDIANIPVVKYFFKWAKTIPICARGKSPKTYQQAFDKVSEELAAGEIVCIFPEGKLTKTGELNEFKKGIEKIISRNPVPVIPLGLKGVWGSFFSHCNGRAFTTLPSRFWSKVEVVADKAVAPADVSAGGLQEKVQALIAS
ncbi:1-acyl-sn-glycerol-3-phosphate acyltransferase [Photobacterium marinum]|uniref:1-acyl-sn-glycerol-3-phosphate acyltransferase n=1 Tax=Photobacterium marinum TaxID=1056511 RepID=L8J7U2_9GAMM|nr:MFS transporter [Photobacterium marinum]ELR64940.1 1-acyl-sn-glycerol-3-phosphate acyltransferase [Photobacterium marinum]